MSQLTSELLARLVDCDCVASIKSESLFSLASTFDLDMRRE